MTPKVFQALATQKIECFEDVDAPRFGSSSPDHILHFGYAPYIIATQQPQQHLLL